jgi:hypothetical protein
LRYDSAKAAPLHHAMGAHGIRGNYATGGVDLRAHATLVLLVLALGGSVARGYAADGPTTAAATAILERFVGEWNTETTVRDGSGREIAHTRGSAAAIATLGGRWYEFRSASTPPGEADLQLMTWDPVARVYRQWVFDADGSWHGAKGTFDAASATLTWRGEKDGATLRIVDHWVSPDRLEWSLRRTDAKGRLVRTVSGVLTRAGRGD